MPEIDASARQAGKCGYIKENGEPCQLAAGWGADNQYLCRYHGDRGPPESNSNGVDNAGGGAPLDNQNAMEHGLHSDPENYLKYLKENNPEGYAWVQRKHQQYLERAPFGSENDLADNLRNIVAMEFAIWNATGKLIEEGMVVEKPARDSDGNPIQYDDDPVMEQKENAVARPLNRAQRTNLRQLDSLGVLPSSNSKHAETMSGLENEAPVNENGNPICGHRCKDGSQCQMVVPLAGTFCHQHRDHDS